MHSPPQGLVYSIYYTTLAVVAVPANLVAIVILSRGKCEISKCITRYLVSMAVTDLLLIITAVIINRTCGIYFPGSFLSITPVCSVIVALTYAARVSSVWLTVAFTFDRFVVICCQKLKAKYCTNKTASVVIGTVCGLSCFINIPWYFIHEPSYIINNVPLYCKLKDIRFTSPLWGAYDWFDHLLTPCFPFLLILLLNVLTVRHILEASRARKRLLVQKSGNNQSDAETENRRKSIILLFAVSGSFILFWMTYLLQFLYERISNDYKVNGYSDPKFIFIETANMLQLLSCCTNAFIYEVTQSKFREQLRSTAQYPVNLIAKCMK
ncbi:probable G-protein coupled receptor 139 [Mobula birostris]|uniref:probable G-protein coupled receptor 139 n=1 Tax=Mobula birostris TaxID=1983395 RepID=UPI003B28926B